MASGNFREHPAIDWMVVGAGCTGVFTGCANVNHSADHSSFSADLSNDSFQWITAPDGMPVTFTDASKNYACDG